MIWLWACAGTVLGEHVTDSGSDTALPAGWAWGDAVSCDTPASGLERLTEQGSSWGLDGVLPEPESVVGEAMPGRGGNLTVSDLDGDGDLDLLAGGLDGQVDVYENLGTRFTRTRRTLVEDLGNGETSSAVAAVDLDGDRLPELVWVSGGAVRVSANLGGLSFGAAVHWFHDNTVSAQTYLTAAIGDVDGDGDLDLALPGNGSVQDGYVEGAAYGGPDLVLVQEGGAFVVSDELWVEEGSLSQLAVFTDRDLDGDRDLLIAADQGPPSAFWRNDAGSWHNDAAEVGAAVEMAAMGVAVADLNGDGGLDYCLSDVGEPRCLLSDGEGGWADGAVALGLTVDEPVEGWSAGTTGWSLELADLDNDGDLDLVQAGGPEPGAYHAGVLDWPDVIWENVGLGFDDVTAEVGFGDVANHIGLVAADFDDDGALEVVVAGPGAAPRLWKGSCTSEHWVQVELVGPPENTDAVGARVALTWEGGAQLREVHALRDQAMGPTRVHQGLGSAERVEVTVTWPDGSVVSAWVPVDRRVTVSW